MARESRTNVPPSASRTSARWRLAIALALAPWASSPESLIRQALSSGALALATLAPAVALAQSGPKLADLDDASLLARATTAGARLADAEKALDGEEKAIAAGAEVL